MIYAKSITVMGKGAAELIGDNYLHWQHWWCGTVYDRE